MALWRKLTLQSNHLISCSTFLSSKRTLYDSSHSSADSIVRSFAAKPQTTLSLSDIIHYTGSTDAKFREYGKFLYNELPIRISHRIVELGSLPYDLSHTDSICELRTLYTHSFHQFRMLHEPNSKDSEALFIDEMIQHFNSVKSATILVANALNNSEMVMPECPFLNAFLDRFQSARIGTRFLTGQYITCLMNKRKGSTNKNSKVLGLIDFECSPKQILQSAASDANHLCYDEFGKCPEVLVTLSESNITFPYITSDLHYILFEIMKNSMRAVCDAHKDTNESEMPPIECVIIDSPESEDVTIKISDRGRGISKENINKIWYYSYTTIEKKPDLNVDKDKSVKSEKKAPMHGFGYGLPLSRLYARYFGGDLSILSMDGYGTDAFIYLHRLKSDDIKPLLV